MNKLLLIGLSVLVIVGGGAGIYFGVFDSDSADLLRAEEGSLVIPDTPAIDSNSPQVVEKPLPKYKGQALRFVGNDPSIQNLTPEVLAAKKDELNKFAEIAEKNPSDALAWLKISEVKKFFNNYKGSADALEYLRLLSPDDFIVNLNLGNLYGFYLNDYKKAEQNFQAAINNSGGYELVAAVLSLADLYKDFYKEKYDQVDDVLLSGIKGAPDDLNLVLKLAFYYKEVNDKKNAIKYFERFLSMPGSSGAQQQAIEDEIVNLNKS